jgi:hypothetical protein
MHSTLVIFINREDSQSQKILLNIYLIFSLSATEETGLITMIVHQENKHKKISK